MSSQMLSGARSMSILSPTKEENAAEFPQKSGRQSPQETTSATSPRPLEDVQILLDTPGTSSPKTSEVPKIASTRPLLDHSSEANTSYPKMHPFLSSSAKHKTYKAPENMPSKPTARDGSAPGQEHKVEDCAPSAESNHPNLPVREHELRDCTPAADSKNRAPISEIKFLPNQSQLLGPRNPAPSAPCSSYPDITLSRVPSLGQTKSIAHASRRISASEPRLWLGTEPEKINTRPIRHSKSSFAETDHFNIADNCRTSKDPLARVSVADDLASLAALAHVLDEEPPEAMSNSNAFDKTTRKKFDEITRQSIEIRLPKLIRELEEANPNLIEESDLARLAKEVTIEYTKGTLTTAKYDILNQSMGECC